MNLENLSEKAREDYTLVVQAQKGEEFAFAELLEKYRYKVYVMMHKMVRNREDAEDITIEAFSKAFTQIKNYAPTHSFSTWLFRIASNHAIDFIRKKRIKAISLDKESKEKSYPLEVRCETKNPEEITISDQRIALTRSIVSELDPKLRELVEYRYFKEYSYQEIADHFDIPLGTVKAKLYRAKNILGDILHKIQERI